MEAPPPAGAGRGDRFVTFATTGTVLVHPGKDGGIHFSDFSGGPPRRPLQFEGLLSTPTIAGDGKILVGIPVSEEPPLRTFDLTTGKGLARFAPLHKGRVGLALSSDGGHLAVWARGVSATTKEEQDQERTVQVLNPRTGKEVRRMRSRDGRVVGAALAPDGKTLALATSVGTVEVWDVGAGKRLRCVQARDGVGFALAYSHDGRRLVAASRTGKVQGWDAATGKRLSLRDGPPCRLGSLAFTPAGQILACGIFRHTLVVWDATTGKRLGRPEGHQDQVEALLFSPDGKRLFSAGREGRLLDWDLGTGRILREWREDLAWHDIRKRPLRDTYMRDGNADYLEPAWFAFSPDGKRRVVIHDERPSLVHTLGLGSVSPALRFLTLREMATGDKVFSVRGWELGPPGIAFSHDGAYLATVLRPPHEDRDDPSEGPAFPRVWDTRTGEQMPSLKGYKGKPLSLALCTDGTRLALESAFPKDDWGVDFNVRLQLWDVTTGREIKTFQSPRQSKSNSLAFSPDDRLLAQVEVGLSVEEEVLAKEWDKTRKTIRLLHATSGRLVHEIDVKGYMSRPGLFSPDGRVLVTAVARKGRPGYELILWETATGKRRKTFRCPRGEVTALAFSADGRLLATGHDDTTVLLWDVTGLRPGEPTADKPSAAALAKSWAELEGADAEQAYRAVLALARTEAGAFLRERLRPVTAKAPDAGQIGRWVRELDDDSFAVRQRAERSLEATGEAAVSALRRVLAGKPSLEMRCRAERVLERILRTDVPAELVRPLRAVEGLELCASAEAPRLLEALARGRPDARLTQEAKAALRRLGRRRAPR